MKDRARKSMRWGWVPIVNSADDHGCIGDRLEPKDGAGCEGLGGRKFFEVASDSIPAENRGYRSSSGKLFLSVLGAHAERAQIPPLPKPQPLQALRARKRSGDTRHPCVPAPDVLDGNAVLPDFEVLIEVNRTVDLGSGTASRAF